MEVLGGHTLNFASQGWPCPIPVVQKGGSLHRAWSVWDAQCRSTRGIGTWGACARILPCLRTPHRFRMSLAVFQLRHSGRIADTAPVLRCCWEGPPLRDGGCGIREERHQQCVVVERDQGFCAGPRLLVSASRRLRSFLFKAVVFSYSGQLRWATSKCTSVPSHR